MSITQSVHNPRAYFDELRSECLSVLHTPMFAIPSLVFPIMFYLFLGVMFGGGNNTEYLLPTYGAFGVIGLGLFGFGVGVAVDRQQGLLQI
ncbi:MAG: ABC-2 type transport system permease protein [Lentisphaeria bacterium]|jgi:ABC-2 type transport system permease protein